MFGLPSSWITLLPVALYEGSDGLLNFMRRCYGLLRKQLLAMLGTGLPVLMFGKVRLMKMTAQVVGGYNYCAHICPSPYTPLNKITLTHQHEGCRRCLSSCLYLTYGGEKVAPTRTLLQYGEGFLDSREQTRTPGGCGTRDSHTKLLFKVV